MNSKIEIGDLVTWKNGRLMVVEKDCYGYWQCAWIDRGKLGREILPEAELIKVQLADPESTLHYDYCNTIEIEEYDELKILKLKLQNKANTISILKNLDYYLDHLLDSQSLRSIP
ncbi:MAG: hypothetical protein ABIQ57_04815 [Candidatus Kapaibacterium sp.]